MGVEKYRRQTGSVRDDRRRNLLGRSGQRKRFIDRTAIEAIDGVLWKFEIVLLERRVAAGVAKEIAENTIVEDAERGPDRHLAISLRIPGESYTGLDVRVVAVIELFSGPWANNRHRDRGRCWITQQVGKVCPLLVGNTVELIAQPKSQRQVAPHLPSVLSIPVVLVLAEMLVVGGLASSSLV